MQARRYQVVVECLSTIPVRNANAFADPFFEIDPIFLAANPDIPGFQQQYYQ